MVTIGSYVGYAKAVPGKSPTIKINDSRTAHIFLPVTLMIFSASNLHLIYFAARDTVSRTVFRNLIRRFAAPIWGCIPPCAR